MERGGEENDEEEGPEREGFDLTWIDKRPGAVCCLD